MGEFVSVSYDAQSLAHIAALSQLSRFLEPEMAHALVRIGDIVVQAAYTNTWSAFQNPTGQLAESIVAIQNGPLEIDIGSNLGYARRLEEGFHGVDSLGRAYNNEPEPYLMPALEEHQDEIMQIMHEAAAEAIVKMGVAI